MCTCSGVINWVVRCEPVLISPVYTIFHDRNYLGNPCGVMAKTAMNTSLALVLPFFPKVVPWATTEEAPQNTTLTFSPFGFSPFGLPACCCLLTEFNQYFTLQWGNWWDLSSGPAADFHKTYMHLRVLKEFCLSVRSGWKRLMVRSWWGEGRGEGGWFDRQTNRQCDCISLISLGNWAKNKRLYLPLGIKQNVSHIFTKHLFLCILINSQDERGSLHWILSKELKGRAGGAWISKPGVLLGIRQHSNPCRVLYSDTTLPMCIHHSPANQMPVGQFFTPPQNECTFSAPMMDDVLKTKPFMHFEVSRLSQV